MEWGGSFRNLTVKTRSIFSWEYSNAIREGNKAPAEFW